ncbi:hypothetical protein [Verrucosispora sp. ts21]|uniref:hypothetical protein n=1 Tax=Verrucosispora sp. ts21 TaxID=2069341 RepID=UPI00130491F4|nr:hypothetical protein [Verrucosispora sp. ts21]
MAHGDVEVEHGDWSGVTVDELVQDGGVAFGVQDAFEDDVVAEVEGGAGGRGDERRCDGVDLGAVVFSEQGSA